MSGEKALRKDVAEVDRSLENRELARLDAEIEPVIVSLLRGTSVLLPRESRGLVVMAALIHHAALLAGSIGMSRADFDRRVSMLADRAFAKRLVAPSPPASGVAK